MSLLPRSGLGIGLLCVLLLLLLAMLAGGASPSPSSSTSSSPSLGSLLVEWTAYDASARAGCFLPSRLALTSASNSNDSSFVVACSFTGAPQTDSDSPALLHLYPTRNETQPAGSSSARSFAESGANYAAALLLPFRLCRQVDGIALARGGQLLFVGCSQPGALFVLDLSSSPSPSPPSTHLLVDAAACGAVYSMDLSSDERTLVVGCAGVGAVIAFQLDWSPSGEVSVRSQQTLVAKAACSPAFDLEPANLLAVSRMGDTVLIACSGGAFLARRDNENEEYAGRWLLNSTEAQCTPRSVLLRESSGDALVACVSGPSALVSVSLATPSAAPSSFLPLVSRSSCSQTGAVALLSSDVVLLTCRMSPIVLVAGTALSFLTADAATEQRYNALAVDSSNRILCTTITPSPTAAARVIGFRLMTQTPLGVPLSGFAATIAAGPNGMALLGDSELGVSAALGPLLLPTPLSSSVCPKVARYGITGNRHGVIAVVCEISSNSTQVFVMEPQQQGVPSPLPLDSLCSVPRSVWVTDDWPMPTLLITCSPLQASSVASGVPSLLAVRGANMRVLTTSDTLALPTAIRASSDGAHVYTMAQMLNAASGKLTSAMFAVNVSSGEVEAHPSILCGGDFAVSRRGAIFGQCAFVLPSGTEAVLGLLRWEAGASSSDTANRVNGSVLVLSLAVSGESSDCFPSMGGVALDRHDRLYAICRSQRVYTSNEDGTDVTSFLLPSECAHASDVAVTPDGDVLLSCTRTSAMLLSPSMRCPPGYSIGAHGCEPCILGQHRNFSMTVERQFQCVSCPLGSVAPLLGSVDCAPCPAGSFAASALLDCQPCSTGHYSEAALSSECSPCPAGRFGSETGLNSSDCSGPCAPGYWCTLASSRADQLRCGAPSVYCPRNSSAPTPIEAGHYTSGATDPDPAWMPASMSFSLPCVPGRYCDGSGQSAPCPPGSFTNRSAAAACDKCPPGRASSEAARLECPPCGPGTYSDTEGAMLCRPCERGTASNDTGRTRSCDDCAPGRSAGSFGMVECPACPESTFTGVAGSVQCQYCAAPAEVSSDSTTCRASNCSANTAYDPARKQCVLCPLGKFSYPGGLCTTCALGSYTPNQGSACVPCDLDHMSGLSCAAGLARVNAGHFAWREWDAQVKQVVYHTASCPDRFCPGTDLQAAASEAPDGPGPASNASLAPVFCVHPRLNDASNLLCGRCVEGYIPWGESCVECSGVNGGMLSLFLLATLCLVIFFLRMSPPGDTSDKALVTLLLLFTQTASVIAGPVRGWLTWLRWPNASAHSFLACLAPLDPYQQLLLAINTPSILLAELAMLALLHRSLFFCLTSAARLPSTFAATGVRHYLHQLILSFTWNRYVSGSVSILLFSYMQVVSAALSFLLCQPVSDKALLFSQPVVDCQSRRYAVHRVLAICVLLIYGLGVPLLVVGLIRKHRRLRLLQFATSDSQTDACTTNGQTDASQQQPAQSELQMFSAHSLSRAQLDESSEASVGSFACLSAGSSLGVAAAAAVAGSVESASSRRVVAYDVGELESDADYAAIHDGDTPKPSLLLDQMQAQAQAQMQAQAVSQHGALASSGVSSSSSLLDAALDPLLFLFGSHARYWQAVLLLRRSAVVLVSVLLVASPVTRMMLLQLVCIASMLLQLYVRPFASARANRLAALSDLLLLLLAVLLGAASHAADQGERYSNATQVAICLLVAPLSTAMLSVILVRRARAWKNEMLNRRI